MLDYEICVLGQQRFNTSLHIPSSQVVFLFFMFLSILETSNSSVGHTNMVSLLLAILALLSIVGNLDYRIGPTDTK